MLKAPHAPAGEDAAFLAAHSAMADEERAAMSRGCQRREREEARRLEQSDGAEELREKVRVLAAMLRTAKHAVVYTGAGMSTAAHIPDYRGPQVRRDPPDSPPPPRGGRSRRARARGRPDP